MLKKQRMRNCWRVFVFSETIKRDYVTIGGLEESKIVPLGHPKFDRIRQNDKLEISDTLKKIENRKIVVWHIHFPKKITVNGKSVMCTPDLSEYFAFAKKIKEYKKKSTNREADQSRKNRNGETKRNEEMNQSRKMNSKMEIGKEPKQIEKNSRADELGKNRMRNKRKRRRSKNMVTVVKKRKSAGLIAVMVIGWILTLTALLAAGAAMAAVWYGQFR